MWGPYFNVKRIRYVGELGANTRLVAFISGSKPFICFLRWSAQPGN
jgi:hypothetical protein